MSPEPSPPAAPLLSEEDVLNSIGWVLVFIGFYVALGGWVLTSRKGKLR